MDKTNLRYIFQRLKQDFDATIFVMQPGKDEFQAICERYKLNYINETNIYSVAYCMLKGHFNILCAPPKKETNYINNNWTLENFPLYRPLFINFIENSDVRVFNTEMRASLKSRRISYYDLDPTDPDEIERMFNIYINNMFNPMELRNE
jgi:hypothetical protein